jgi:hypothetical protein
MGDEVLPQKIVEGLKTKADMIRALDRAGMARADIARFLNIRYQHVRSTLESKSEGARSVSSSTSREVQHREQWRIERLIDAGFHLLGECSLSSADTFVYSVKAPTEPGVYVFAIDGLVKYVGLTRWALRTRLGHYVYGHKAQRTSARVKELILAALRSEQHVQVLIATPAEMEWNGLPVDGAAGLETGLIRLIRPEWNQQGNLR